MPVPLFSIEHMLVHCDWPFGLFSKCSCFHALSRLVMAMVFVLEGCIPLLCSIRGNSRFWLHFRLLDFDK